MTDKNNAAPTSPRNSVDHAPIMLAEIKRMTGWSWERISSALGCSRQEVHYWTLGKEINQHNLERLAQLHATIAHIDRGSSEENGALLASSTEDGRIFANLLDGGEFEAVRRLLGPGGCIRQDRRWVKLAGMEASPHRRHWYDRLIETNEREA